LILEKDGMRKIPKEIITQLIEIGRHNKEEVPASLADPEKAWISLICGWQPWRVVAQEMSESDLENLIKGYVLYTRARPTHSGGSASPAIELYRSFAERFPHKSEEIADWIFINRINHYEPLGTSVDFGARSLKEYISRRAEHKRLAKLNMEKELLRQKEASNRRKETATQRLATAVRRGDLKAVKSLLDRGADLKRALPEGESLVALAKDNGRDDVANYLLSLGVA
jgi:hypothetical protein